MADLAHLVERFGGFEALRGKRVAMTWAYSPSYGKPLSVPQGVIGLFTRFGMDVRLAYPEGYSLMGDVVEKAGAFAKESGGAFRVCATMEEAFDGADVVYPKSWAPFAVMEERTRIVGTGDRAALAELEKRCLANNARFKSWECTDALMARTRDALYLHCLPADITGVSCAQGEVAAGVFERFRVPLYRQAGWKPYVIAAMILAAKFKDPAERLARLARTAGRGSEPRGGTAGAHRHRRTRSRENDALPRARRRVTPLRRHRLGAAARRRRPQDRVRGTEPRDRRGVGARQVGLRAGRAPVRQVQLFKRRDRAHH